nr:crosslink repair DNA glycosylase YcaQ family protein [Oceanospirillum sediminis]
MIRLRRLALSAQGLLKSQPYGRGLAGARKAINHIGYVQIDTISVIERAHNHVLYSRVPGFRPDMLHRMLLDRDVFEYWSHAAAFLPISDFRFSLPYKNAIKSGQVHWYKKPDRKLMQELLERIRQEGPIRSRDIETCKTDRAGWWDWKPAKKALEQLYMEGDLMVSQREGFQKVYDLTERVLPYGVDTRVPSTEELAEHLLDQHLRCHGLASLKSVTYLRKNTGLRAAVNNLVNERLTQGSLEQVRVNDGETFVVASGAFDSPLPRSNARVQILSPFDNSVIQRDRLKALFQYHYQLECYLPETKRQYGYFCLPLLYRDEFIGRMDCKAHRKEGRLEVRALYFENHSFDEDEVITALADALPRFCQFQQCQSVSLTNVYPAYLTHRFSRQFLS